MQRVAKHPAEMSKLIVTMIKLVVHARCFATRCMTDATRCMTDAKFYLTRTKSSTPRIRAAGTGAPNNPVRGGGVPAGPAGVRARCSFSSL